ncbi:MAG TPA: beta-1,6-N-acetylglucosaminyltransferase, partial [Herpetosiphonaceae bacterium]
FCNPINKVQTIYDNRAGDAPQYAADHLANLFEQGYRVRVTAYAGFVPSACHQEVDLLYERQPDAPPANRHISPDQQPLRMGYLILAHNTPNHFSRLVHALDDGHARIYVHIDQKSSLLPFQQHVPGDRVRFIGSRIPVYWSDYSTAQAILNLIAEALDHDPGLEYLCLLSGSDYPLQSAGYIRHFLTQRRGTEFINLLPMPNPTLGKPIERLTQYRFRPDRAQKLAQRLNVPQLPIFSRDYRTYLGELQPYGGSTWWALSRAACEYILGFVAQNPRVVKFFKHTLFPEEGFFQTIIGNSPFRMHVAHNLTYNDWTRPNPPYPAIIDEQHLRQVFAAPLVVANDAFGTGELLFVRKFPDDSQRLVAQLQARLEAV